VDLDDFSVFAWQLESESEWDDLPETCTPTYQNAPDVALIETWVEDDLMALGQEDPAWVDAIENVVAILEGYDDPDYDDLIGALDDINFRPVSNSNWTFTSKNTDLWFPFAPHYSDPDGDELNPSVVTLPSNGRIVRYELDLQTGKLVRVKYKPDPGYTGPDSFTWKAVERYTSERYESDPHATVSIAVTDE